MIQVREFTNGADVIANYKRTRDVFFPPRRTAPTQVASTAERAAENTIVAPVTRKPSTGSMPLPFMDEILDQIKVLARSNHPSFSAHARAMQIIRHCSSAHDVSEADILAPGNGSKNVIAARHQAVAAVYVEFPQWSTTKIANLFQLKSHSTVVRIIQKVGLWERRREW